VIKVNYFLRLFNYTFQLQLALTTFLYNRPQINDQFVCFACKTQLLKLARRFARNELNDKLR
jgi:hypothetical protein